MTENPDCWHDLATAVILRAIEDYRAVCYMLRLHPYQNNLAETKIDIETFFSSRWFRTLTAIDGKELLMMIRKDI